MLVTGGAGFLGRALVQRLLRDGYDVHATSRDISQIAERGGDRAACWWQIDPADGAATEHLFADIKPNFVFHLSGRTGAAPDIDLVLPSHHSLTTSTLNVLVSGAKHGAARIVLFASCNEPVAGDPDLVPVSPYAAGKWMSSIYGRMFHKLYGTPVVSLKPFMAYGPGQSEAKFIPTVVTSLLRNVSPRLSSGRTRGDWVYLDDVMDACVAAIVVPGIEGRAFDLGTGVLVAQRRIVELLVGISGRDIVPSFGALADRPHEHEVVADVAPAREYLDWTARNDLQQGLAKTWAWFEARARGAS